MKNKELVFTYLDSNIHIKENRYVDITLGKHMFGDEIVNELVSVFAFGRDSCVYYLLEWAYGKGIRKKRFDLIYKTQIIDVELTLESYIAEIGVPDPTHGQLVDFIVTKLNLIIDEPRLVKAGPYLEDLNGIINIMSCLGYVVTLVGDNRYSTPFFKIIDTSNVFEYRKLSDAWQMMEMRERATSS